jgi:hypothetical protein
MHQSDPPRRAFIESLVAFLVREKLGVAETWQAELDAVQKRVETHDITNTPFLSGWAVAVAFTLLLLPLGVRLSTEDGWMALGWTIIAAPFCIAITNWWAWRRHRWIFPLRTFFTKKNFTTNRRPYRNRSVASIFVSKSTDKTVNTILKTPEPTSIEFRATFIDVLAKLSLPSNKVVFILDNLDRISPEDAFTIWSTFRALFASPDDIAEECGVDFHVVIPIDFNSLKRIYSKALDSKTEESDGVQSLVEKSFDVVIRVPPPVQSDWIDYAREKLRYVAKDLTDQQVHNASVIFKSSLEFSSSSSRITPRQINNFANRVGSEIIVADKSVDLEGIFYYAAFSRVASSYDIQSIVSVDAPGAAIISRMNKEWRASVAALHFGVDKARALQLLIGDEVVETVLSEKADRMAELAQLPGFDLVLTNLLRTDSGRGPYFYAAAAGLLPEHFAAGVAGDEIWDLLVDAIPLDGAWDKISLVTAEGLRRLGARGEDKFLERAVASLSVAEQGFAPNPRLWLTHIQTLLAATGDGRASVLSRLAVPSGQGFYVGVMRELSAVDLPLDARKVLRPRGPSADIIAEVIMLLVDEAYSPAASQVIGRMTVVDFPWDWAALIEAVRAAVAEAEDSGLAINALRVLLTVPDGDDALSALGDSGNLADVFAAAWEAGKPDNLSMVIEAVSYGWPDLEMSGSVGESAEGYRLITSLDTESEAGRNEFVVAARLAIKRNSPVVVRGLLNWASAKPGSKDTIFTAILNAFNADEVGSLYVADTIPHVVAMARGDSPAGKAIVQKISYYVGFWEGVTKQDPYDVAFVLNTVNKSTIDSKEAILIQGVYDRLDEAYWRDVIENKRSILRALDGIITLYPNFRISPSLAAAHDAYINDVIGGRFDLVTMNVSWRRLLAASEPSALERSIQQALDLAETGNVESKEKILGALDDGLIQSEPAKRESIRIITQVVLPILRGGSESALKLLVKRSSALAAIVKRARGRNRAELISRIEAAREAEALSDAEAATLRNNWSLVTKQRTARTKP